MMATLRSFSFCIGDLSFLPLGRDIKS